MGGGGSIGMMNSIIKNNRNLLSKRDRFKRKNAKYECKKLEFKTPNASPHALKRLRLKIKHEQKELRQKRLIVSGIIIVTLLSVILYYL